METRLERLLDDLRDDRGDRLVVNDESDYFRIIDQAADDPDAAPVLARIGARFAACFVAPYLHAEDLAGVLAELGGLLAIHHRGRLVVEELDEARAVVTVDTASLEGSPGRPTVFDLALIDATLRTRFGDVAVQPRPPADGTTAPGALEIHVRRPEGPGR